MTVIEIIKKYGLEDFDKRYKNLLGESRDTAFPLDELKNMEVKGVKVDIPTMEAVIILQTVR